MVKKKRGREINIKINLTNRWLYTLIAIGILAIIGVGVYALTPGVAPNPGHLANEMAPPTPCSANQFLKFDGTNWVCSEMVPPSPCASGQSLRWNGASLVCIWLNKSTVDLTGLMGIQYVSSSTSNQAYCPAGTKVIGGGCTCSNSYNFLVSSYPVPSSNYWSCSCDSVSGRTSHAICVNAIL